MTTNNNMYTEAELVPVPVEPDSGLLALVNEWKELTKKVEDCWVHIVEYVSDNEIDKLQIRTALKAGEMPDVTARNEAGIIRRVACFPEDIEDYKNGKITVRELRKAGIEPKVRQPKGY